MKCWALKEADETSSIKPSPFSIAVFKFAIKDGIQK